MNEGLRERGLVRHRKRDAAQIYSLALEQGISGLRLDLRVWAFLWSVITSESSRNAERLGYGPQEALECGGATPLDEAVLLGAMLFVTGRDNDIERVLSPVTAFQVCKFETVAFGK